jgi:hypothetical protein
MNNGPIAPGTGVSLNGKKPTLRSSEESQFLYLILKAVQGLNASLYNVFTSLPVAFTVGTTVGAPVNGASTWTISTINVIGKSPVFLLGGIPQVSGVDYTFNNSTGTLTLLSTTFATSDVWTIIY